MVDCIHRVNTDSLTRGFIMELFNEESTNAPVWGSRMYWEQSYERYFNSVPEGEEVLSFEEYKECVS